MFRSNPKRPSCIDLFCLNCANHFLKTEILETDLSDFRKLIITAANPKFEKKSPQTSANCYITKLQKP